MRHVFAAALVAFGTVLLILAAGGLALAAGLYLVPVLEAPLIAWVSLAVGAVGLAVLRAGRLARRGNAT